MKRDDSERAEVARPVARREPEQLARAGGPRVVRESRAEPEHDPNDYVRRRRW